MSWFEAANPLLPDLIRLNARWKASAPAVECDGGVLSWSALNDELARTANGLSALGLRKGDPVVVLMQNSIEMLTVMLGAIHGGFVAVPLNVSVADDGICKQIDDCQARAIVACKAHAPRIDELAGQLPAQAVRRRILAGAGYDGWLSLDELKSSASVSQPSVAIAPGDACNVIYSSGTTGLPKGILHSHACRMAWAYDMSIALRYHSDVRTLVSLGLYSNITWVTMLNTILCGGTIVLKRQFDVENCLATIESQRITHAGMVPVQLQRLLEAPTFDEYDLSSLESLMCCGSPLHVNIKREILERVPGDFIELYGLTEGLVTIQSPDDATEFLGSVGRPCPGQFVEILDDDDVPLPAGETGEIVGYGRLLMSGYLNRDDESEAATWTDEDGRRWLRTGDIGRVDEHGNLYLVDRKKDMIISGGQNIYPADIEAVIAAHPQVTEVAVIGVASSRWGESPLAVVCGDATDAEALLDWTNDKVGRQQRIAAIRLVDELPRNPNGKVLKRELRERFNSALENE